MDTTAVVIVVVAAVIIAALFWFRAGPGRRAVEGTLGRFGSVKASSEQPPGALIEDAKSHRGGITAEDQTGQGAAARRVEAEGDIRASSRAAARDQDPKA